MATYNNSVVVKFDTKENGNAGAGASVTVYYAGTNIKADIIHDGSDPTANPLFADAEGNYSFEVNDGFYDIVINEGLLSEQKIENQQIATIISFDSATGHYESAQDAIASPIEVGEIITTAGYYNPNDGGAGQYIVVTGGTGTDDGGSYLDMVNGNQLELIVDRVVNVHTFGVTQGVDSTTEFQSCVDFCGSSSIREIELGRGDYRLNTINKTFEYLTIKGVQAARTDKGGTRISFIGNSGALFENGVDDGLPWDDNIYDGPQGLTLKNLNLYNGSPNRTEPLNNTGSFYSIGSYAVRDWRGGHIEYNNIFVEGFEYNFWGINSDFNKFISVTQAYTKYGFYMGPRSDQSYFRGFYCFLCDTVLNFDGAANGEVHSMQLVISGSTTDYQVRMYKGSQNVTFYEPWLESYSGIVDALEFFDIGSVDGYSSTSAVLGVDILNPYVAVGTAGASGPNHIAAITKGERIKIKEPIGARGTSTTTNLSGFFYIPSGVSASGFDLIFEGVNNTKTLVNDGTGTPNLCEMMTDSQWTFSSQSGRFSIKDINGAAGADEIRIGQEGLAGRIAMDIPNYTGGQTRRLDLRRTQVDSSGVPSSGSYEIGDYVRNTNPIRLGVAGAYHIIKGWTRITTGSGHVLGTDWAEDVAPTANIEGVQSVSGRFFIYDTDAPTGAESFYLSQEGLAGRVSITAPNYSGGQTRRLDLQRIFDDESSIPSMGSYESGDYVRNINPSVLGSGGSQYIVRGWTRLTTGSGHVLNTDWVEDRALTGT